jgi:hypothetical protein
MLEATELENPLPRVRAALLQHNERAMWRIADRMARILWCSMAHIDYEVYPAFTWEQLPESERRKLNIAMWNAITVLNRLIELAPEPIKE